MTQPAPADEPFTVAGTSDPRRLEEQLRDHAQELGFDLCGIAAAVSPTGINALQDWIDAGFAGEMGYIPRRAEAYRHPENVLPNVRSVVMVAMNYHDGTPSPASQQRASRGESRLDSRPHSESGGGATEAVRESDLQVDRLLRPGDAGPSPRPRPSQRAGEVGGGEAFSRNEPLPASSPAVDSRAAEPWAGNDSALEAASPGGRVANYARSSVDYHDLLKRRLKQLAAFLHEQRPGCRTRPVVDTAPLLERDFARLAGLGWFGKNTMLINRRLGSWLFLGALLTDVELQPDAPHDTSHCGTCTRCLDACPTDAFVEPYVLDARRCISYLTIELRDQPIPESLRDGMGDWVFGCDVCQDVCPWNRKAPPSNEPAFAPVADLTPADLNWLLRLSEDEFRTRFRGTPFERPGRSGILRNAAIAAGNSADAHHLPALQHAATDTCDLIRDAANWAIDRLAATE